jgi:acetyltransferase-like isoleucine patch superfamily enzyme
MFLLNITRNDLLGILPAAKNIAEIGVYRGCFASRINKECSFNQLHLIDPWSLDPNDEYVRKYNCRDDMDALYKQILTRFDNEISLGKIVLHRDYSYNVAKQLPNNYFDWIYVDGMHSYEAVYKDLIEFAPKMKEDGFILGHDFSNTPLGRKMMFGVVAAVRRFSGESDWKIILITNEDAPSYLLARNTDSERYKKLMHSLLNRPGISIVEIDDSMLSYFAQTPLKYLDGKRKHIISIVPTAVDNGFSCVRRPDSPASAHDVCQPAGEDNGKNKCEESIHPGSSQAVIASIVSAKTETEKVDLFYTKDHLRDDIEKKGWTVGDFTYGRPKILGSGAKLHIGKFCSISSGVRILLGYEHRTDWVTTYPFSVLIKRGWTKGRGIKGHPHSKGNVVIGDDVWIASDSTILSGVTIGTGAVISTCSLVTKDVPSYSIVAGVPARVAGYRFRPEIIEKLLATAWWERSVEEINEIIPFLLSDDPTAAIDWLETHPALSEQEEQTEQEEQDYHE